MQGLSKEICCSDSRNNEKMMQRTQTLVQKGIQKNFFLNPQKGMMVLHFIITKQGTPLQTQNIFGAEKCYWRRLIMEGLEIKKLPAMVRSIMQSVDEIDPC